MCKFAKNKKNVKHKSKKKYKSTKLCELKVWTPLIALAL